MSVATCTTATTVISCAEAVDDVYIPVYVGGGLQRRGCASSGDGADKVAINTAAIKRPRLIMEVAEAFGSQCMVLSIQAKRSRTWPDEWEAYYDNGRAHSGYSTSSVGQARRGAGARADPADQRRQRGLSRVWTWNSSGRDQGCERAGHLRRRCGMRR